MSGCSLQTEIHFCEGKNITVVDVIIRVAKNGPKMLHVEQNAVCRLRLKCDGTSAETRFRLSAKIRVRLNRRGRPFSRLLAAEVCASAVVMVVMLDKPSSEVV